MLIGFFDSASRPRLTVLVGGRRASKEIDAIIDTGFNGALTLPIDVAVQLGLELTGRVNVQLADGTMKSELLFAGAVTLDSMPQRVPVGLTSSADALIGTELLAGRRLTLDFDHRTISIV